MKQLFYFLYLIIVALTPPVFAGDPDQKLSPDQRGHGTKGAQGVVINGQPSLRDLVENTVCFWEPAEAFVAKNIPAFAQTVTKLASLDKGLATAVLNEVGSAVICPIKGELRQVSEEDQNGLAIYIPKTNSKQTIIRYQNKVYIDINQLAALGNTPKGAEIQAEAFMRMMIHPYIP